MSKASEKFLKQIHELALTQQYDKEVVKKLVNISVETKKLAIKETRNEVAKTLINISIVAKSLADKIQAFKGQQV